MQLVDRRKARVAKPLAGERRSKHGIASGSQLQQLALLEP